VWLFQNQIRFRYFIFSYFRISLDLPNIKTKQVNHVSFLIFINKTQVNTFSFFFHPNLLYYYASQQQQQSSGLFYLRNDICHLMNILLNIWHDKLEDIVQ